MTRIFITGSADGLGQLAARLLVQQGHQVVLHGRSPARARQALAAVPQAEATVSGDLAGLRQVAEQANALERFDAVIHNAGVGYREPRRAPTAGGLPLVLAVNSLAPYVLTCLLTCPDRLVYLSPGLHGRVMPACTTSPGPPAPGAATRPAPTRSCTTCC
ncbi:MAG: SDR family NAD(P)-dependent oxidoreductase [Janthinobacterium lividum]